MSEVASILQPYEKSKNESENSHAQDTADGFRWGGPAIGRNACKSRWSNNVCRTIGNRRRRHGYETCSVDSRRLRLSPLCAGLSASLLQWLRLLRAALLVLRTALRLAPLVLVIIATRPGRPSKAPRVECRKKPRRCADVRRAGFQAERVVDDDMRRFMKSRCDPLGVFDYRSNPAQQLGSLAMFTAMCRASSRVSSLVAEGGQQSKSRDRGGSAFWLISTRSRRF